MVSLLKQRMPTKRKPMFHFIVTHYNGTTITIQDNTTMSVSEFLHFVFRLNFCETLGQRWNVAFICQYANCLWRRCVEHYILFPWIWNRSKQPERPSSSNQTTDLKRQRAIDSETWLRRLFWSSSYCQLWL